MGRKPPVPGYPVCVECRLKENVCAYDRGLVCVGPGDPRLDAAPSARVSAAAASAVAAWPTIPTCPPSRHCSEDHGLSREEILAEYTLYNGYYALRDGRAESRRWPNEQDHYRRREGGLRLACRRPRQHRGDREGRRGEGGALRGHRAAALLRGHATRAPLRPGPADHLPHLRHLLERTRAGLHHGDRERPRGDSLRPDHAAAAAADARRDDPEPRAARLLPGSAGLPRRGQRDPAGGRRTPTW